MTSPLAAISTALSAHYAVERELGRGGMATVYLAEDRKHARQVAIKVLNPDLGATLGAERFLSEIRVTASLQHPNLLPLFDSGAADGLLYYVMPFVRGETLRARLVRERELPVDEALRITTAIGAALEHAHRAQVLHRDLKPENILLQDGQPVVADFGIALAVSNASGARATQTGLSLGTPQYMSPEQAAGDRQLDARSDQYALAAICYEMLAGEPPHVGMNVAATMAKLMTDTPAPLRLRRELVPAHVEWAVAKALSKRPADRFASVAEFTRALASSGAFESVTPPAARSTPSRTRMLWLAAPWVIAVGALGYGIRPRPATMATAMTAITAPVRLNIPSPAEAPFVGGQARSALSADGSALYYVSNTGGVRSIMHRDLVSDSVRALPGGEGTIELRLSPDGSRLLLLRAADAAILPRVGGLARALPLEVRIGDWLDDESLVFENAEGGLSRYHLADGAITALTEVDTATATGQRHSRPLTIADGRFVLFQSATRDVDEAVRVGVVNVASGTHRLLDLRAVTPLGFVQGHLVYVDEAGRLAGRPLSLETGTLGAEREFQRNIGIALAGVSAVITRSGTLMYMAAPTRMVILRYDLSGAETVLDTVDARGMAWARLSPDGTRLMGHVRRDSISDTFVYHLQRRTLTRVTFGRVDFSGFWLPDGNQFLVSSARDGVRGIWLDYADKSQPARKLFTGGGVIADLTPDGRQALIHTAGRIKYLSIDDGSVSDPPGGPLEVRALELEPVGAISPDGSLIAYTARSSGAIAVYVRALATGATLQVSVDGAWLPEFLRDGRLVYREGARHLVTRIRTSPTLRADEPQVLDQIEARGDRTADGRAIIAVRSVQPQRGLFIVLNWAQLVADSGAQ